MSSFGGVGVAFNENTLLSTVDCDNNTLVTVVVGLALLTAIDNQYKSIVHDQIVINSLTDLHCHQRVVVLICYKCSSN